MTIRYVLLGAPGNFEELLKVAKKMGGHVDVSFRVFLRPPNAYLMNPFFGRTTYSVVSDGKELAIYAERHPERRSEFFYSDPMHESAQRFLEGMERGAQTNLTALESAGVAVEIKERSKKQAGLFGLF